MANPADSVVRGADRYMRTAGLTMPHADYASSYITQPASKALSAAYDKMPDFDRKALPAYHAMREETMRQFDHMTAPRSKGGMGMDVEVTKHDPYGSEGTHSIFGEFRNDVVNHNRLRVLSTASTGGHPVFSNDDNDAFRAVHDVFGHLGSGRGVDYSGEEAAFQKHSRMYSPLARQAMATETRGQNAALRLHGDFQEQKVGLLSEHLQGLQFSRTGSALDRAAAIALAAEKNRSQGI